VNVVFVSHCDFHGNSAMHIFSIANQLADLGVASAVCVPNDPATVRSHGEARFIVLHHSEVYDRPILFADGRGPDLIHAWTPRELVRRVTESLAARYEVPFLVHLEDNEQVILEDELGGTAVAELERLPAALVDELVADHRTHPLRSRRFMEQASGVTALIDRLLEFKPQGIPGLVFWPGYDEAFANAEPDPAFRRRLRLPADATVVAYTGNVHHSNASEARSLVAAVAALRRLGHPMVLIKTGWNFADVPLFERGTREKWIRDLGFLARDDVPRLVACSDVLVQPGRSGDFNDYRFPSKLPEFLVSGRPVVLPRTNIGRFLRDETECVLLHEGHALEIAARVEPLLLDEERRMRIGAGGRAFALSHLSWARSASLLKDFYQEILGGGGAVGSAAATREPAPGTVQAETTPREASATPRPAAAPYKLPKLIAFYLPQFHRIKENDEWWGEGFTEWTNVRRAEPNFEGHEQPLLPSDLGFYDLADADILDRQAALARRFGLHGFCFYYYWFDGRRLLERPVEHMLERGKPDMPFCICWANENWTRRWDGSEDETLIRQDYRPQYAERFIQDVIPVLKDRRYIRVGAAPLLLVYRVDLLPDAADAARAWRRVCAEEGIPEIHLAAVQSFGISDPRPFGFDAAVEFPPHVTRHLLDSNEVPGVAPDFEGYLEDYLAVARDLVVSPPPPFLKYRGVMPAWDNTPRRQRRAHVCVNSSPQAYETWLRTVVAQTMARSSVQEPLVFINAWNEWAEGAFLEPDECNGYARLRATARGLCDGLADFYAQRGFPLTSDMVHRALASDGLVQEDEL